MRGSLVELEQMTMIWATIGEGQFRKLSLNDSNHGCVIRLGICERIIEQNKFLGDDETHELCVTRHGIGWIDVKDFMPKTRVPTWSIVTTRV